MINHEVSKLLAKLNRDRLLFIEFKVFQFLNSETCKVGTILH